MRESSGIVIAVWNQNQIKLVLMIIDGQWLFEWKRSRVARGLERGYANCWLIVSFTHGIGMIWRYDCWSSDFG